MPAARSESASATTTPSPILVVLVCAAAGYAALGATFPSHSTSALVAVLLPSALAIGMLARRARTGAIPGRIGARHRVWLVWAAVFTLWELAALVLDELSLSLLWDPVLEIYPFRLAAWLLWLYVGWLLVRPAPRAS